MHMITVINISSKILTVGKDSLRLISRCSNYHIVLFEFTSRPYGFAAFIESEVPASTSLRELSTTSSV